MTTKSSIIAALIMTLALTAAETRAQVSLERYREDITRAATMYHGYEFAEIEDTPAPRGFKPFYISHYGRHGSRYHVSESYFEKVRVPLVKAEEAGILSETGKELLSDIKALMDTNEGMYEQLSPKGGREHIRLAERMSERFPEIFGNSANNKVNCLSSIYPRCLTSMAWFSTALKGKNPGLEISFQTGDKYMEIINNQDGVKAITRANEKLNDSLLTAWFDPSRLMSVLFTDSVKAKETIANPCQMCLNILLGGAIAQNLDSDINTYKYLTFDELVTLSNTYNNKMYVNHCNSEYFGEERIHKADQLLKDVVMKAEAAIAGNGVCADLRFGHDTGLMPFAALMGLKGWTAKADITNAHEYWSMEEMVPMAANIQIVFYKNKKGKILVKILQNEKETTIEKVKPVTGPYYDWKDLKNYFQTLTSGQ